MLSGQGPLPKNGNGAEDVPAEPDATPVPVSHTTRAAGVVRDEATGRPIGDARVAVIAEGDTYASTWVAVGKEGEFDVGLPPDVPSRVVVVAPAYLPWEEGVASDEARHLEVGLQRGAAISGVVVDDLGEPLEGVEVWSTTHRTRRPWPGPEGTIFRASSSTGGRTTSNESGEFTIYGNDAESVYQLGWRKGHYIPAHKSPRVAPGSGEKVRLHMRAMCRIRLSIFDRETSAPVEGATVGTHQPRFGVRLVPGAREGFLWDIPRKRGIRYAVFARDLQRGVEDSPVHDEVPEALIKVRAPGYHDEWFKVPLAQWGSVTDYRVEMLSQGPSQPKFRIKALWSDGTPFDGTLLVKYAEHVVSVPFASGLSTGSIALPKDVNRFWITGDGAAASWWNPTGTNHSADDVQGGWLGLTVSGHAVELDVRTADGGKATTYRVQVLGANLPANIMLYKDFPEALRLHGTAFGVDVPNAPHVFLRAGTYKIFATFEDRLVGSADIVVPSSGVAMPLKVRIKMDKEVEGGRRR
jgi:hypothetical protein